MINSKRGLETEQKISDVHYWKQRHCFWEERHPAWSSFVGNCGKTFWPHNITYCIFFVFFFCNFLLLSKLDTVQKYKYYLKICFSGKKPGCSASFRKCDIRYIWGHQVETRTWNTTGTHQSCRLINSRKFIRKFQEMYSKLEQSMVYIVCFPG